MNMIILAGGGFIGSFIAIAVLSILFFVGRLIIGGISSSIYGTKFSTDGLSDINDLNQLNKMLSYWASEQAHDPQRIVAICYRILKLKPDDYDAQWWLLISVPKYRSYSKNDEALFNSLYQYYKDMDPPPYLEEESYPIFLYLYSYYCSEEGDLDRSQKLLVELKNVKPRYESELKFFVENWPITKS